MDVVGLEEVRVDVVVRSMSAHPGQSGLHGFLHNVPHVPGHREMLSTLHGCGFHKEHVAPGRRPGQPYCHTWPACTLDDLRLQAETRDPQEVLNILWS